MAHPTVMGVLSEHMISRTLYEKFRSCVPSEPELRHAIALFMALDIVAPVNQIATDCSIMRKLLKEAKFVLNCLKQDDEPRHWMELPLINSTSEKELDTDFLDRNRDCIMIMLVRILDGVKRVVFNDHLYGLFVEWEALVARARDMGAVISTAVPVPVPPQFAVLFHPSPAVLRDPAPSELMIEDARSMFISFKKHQHIRKRTIIDYFTQRWGDCVERIWVSKNVPEGKCSVYGRITFRSYTYIALALDDQNSRRFWICGVPLWADKYHAQSTID